MRTAYRILAFALVAATAVQAMAMGYATAGLFAWVGAEGGTLDKAALEGGDLSFTGAGGFELHAVNGMMVMPVLALALLVVAFFAAVPRGVPVAGVLLALVVAQVLLGLGGHSVPFLGALHGLVGLVIFAGALHVARLAGTADTSAGDVVRV